MERERDMAEWVRIFRDHDVIWGPVPTTQQVAADVQMESNGVFRNIAGGPRTIDTPIRMDGVEKSAPTLAPRVGEHSEDVLRSIGYSDAEVEELVRRGVTMSAAVTYGP
jgi:crotonobetainyl-CoA:carnitine CoA-transferase CaiB-like acyl-CoA transferase